MGRGFPLEVLLSGRGPMILEKGIPILITFGRAKSGHDTPSSNIFSIAKKGNFFEIFGRVNFNIFMLFVFLHYFLVVFNGQYWLYIFNISFYLIVHVLILICVTRFFLKTIYCFTFLPRFQKIMYAVAVFKRFTLNQRGFWFQNNLHPL